MCDADTADILLERIAKQPGKSSAQEFLVHFRELARSASPRLIPPLYEAMNKDVGKSMVPEASALCIVLDRKCLRDRDQLNTLAGDPKAYDALQSYIGTALVSPDTGVVMRACEFGVPFAPSLSGLHGQYYEGRLLDTLAVEKIDAQIAVPNRQFPLPNNRQDDIAARWTGMLNIGKSSTNYTFTLFGERTASLFIDGQYVVGSSNWQEQQKVLSLTNGPHAIQVVFQQDTGNSRVELYWSGPDFAKQLLAGAPLSTPAWKSELEKLRGLVAGLATTDPQQLATTTNAIRAYGPLAAVLLRQAVRYETNAVSPKAAGMLAALQDAGLAEAALDHLKSRPDSPVIHGLVSALGQSVTNLTQDQDVWLYQSVQQDAQFARPWHAGLLVRVLKDACAGNKDRFNALVKDPKGSDTLKAYSDAIQKQGPKAPAGWTNEFGIVTTP